MIASRIVGLLLIPLAVAVLAACQSTMSVEEAKKVTVAFGGSRFVPPPRTTNDIVALLDQQRLTELEFTRELRTEADQPTPNIADPKARAAILLRRGAAARELGRTRQAIADLTQAGQLAPSPQVLVALARAENFAGNQSQAINHLREALRIAPANAFGMLVPLNCILASWNARAGNFEAAEGALRDCLGAQAQSSRTTPPNVRSFQDALVASAQSDLSEARGALQDAEQTRRQAIEDMGTGADTGPGQFREGIAALFRSGLGALLARQGRLLEGENEAREALLQQLRRQGRNAPRTAAILKDLTAVIAEQGRYAEAEVLSREVIDIYQRIGTPADWFRLALARSDLASALAAQQRWTDALSEYDRIRADLAGDAETYARYFKNSVTQGLALLKSGRADEATAMLQGGLEQNRRALGETHTNTAEIHGLIGMAYTAKGDLARAIPEFREATNVLLTRSLALEDEGTTRPMRDQRLGLVLESYIGALATLRGTPLERQLGLDAAAEAFRLADVARGRTVQRALDAGAARAAARTPALADLIRKEQDARKQLSALYVALSNALGMPADAQDAKSLDRLRRDIDTLRRAREALTKEIDARFPAYGDLINPRPATVDQVRARLRSGEALIATLVTAERTFVWAVPQSGQVAFAVSPMGERPLAEAIAKVRKSVDTSEVQSVGDVPRLDVSTAHELYRRLLEPVASGWEPASHLLIVGHGPLGHLPFALLPRKGIQLGPDREPLFSNYRAVPWLIRSHAVTVLPSVTALVTLRSLPSADADRKPFIGFGDPYFSEEQARRAAQSEERRTVSGTGLPTRSRPLAVRSVAASPKDGIASSQLAGLPRLPDTADEILGIAAAMKADPGVDVFLGERANTQTVKALDLTRYRVVAFATHGLVPGDLDGLTQPALALSAPEVAKTEGDGLLTMQDILALRLNADWVVLSACNTANGNGSGAEAISGLGRAFFYAGARAVLVTSWPVETTSARMLTTTLFKRLSDQSTLTRAKALQQTLNTLIDDGVLVDPDTKQVVFSYAHPIFWAPFVLVGD